MTIAEERIRTIIADYTLTEAQQQTKNFSTQFPLRKKNLRMWTYFLTTYGRRSPMMRQTIKHDLRYFRDAAVDTLVPMSR